MGASRLEGRKDELRARKSRTPNFSAHSIIMELPVLTDSLQACFALLYLIKSLPLAILGLVFLL